MGLGLSDSDYNQYYIGIKSQKIEGANKIPYSHLVVQKKINGELRTQKDERGISGWIRAISHSTYDWEGAEQKVLSLKLVEGNDLFKIDCNIDSTIGRNLANSILTITPDTVQRLHLRCYEKKSKTDGRTYPHVWIGSSDEQEDGLKWAFSLDDVKHLIRKVEDPTKPGSGKLITVNYDLNIMLWNKWLELEKEVNPIYKEMEEKRKKTKVKATAAVPLTVDRSDAPEPQETVDKLDFDQGEPIDHSTGDDELPF